MISRLISIHQTISQIELTNKKIEINYKIFNNYTLFKLQQFYFSNAIKYYIGSQNSLIIISYRLFTVYQNIIIILLQFTKEAV